MAIALMVIIAFVANLARWASILTFIAGVGVWATQFLSEPVFQNASQLTGEIFGLFGWSLLAFVTGTIMFVAIGVSAGLNVTLFGQRIN